MLSNTSAPSVGGVVASIVMLVSPLQPPKAKTPILVIPLPIVTLVRP